MVITDIKAFRKKLREERKKRQEHYAEYKRLDKLSRKDLYNKKLRRQRAIAFRKSLGLPARPNPHITHEILTFPKTVWNYLEKKAETKGLRANKWIIQHFEKMYGKAMAVK